jgi:hypothetical protein
MVKAAQWIALLGEQVTITLATDDDHAVAHGRLLAYSDDGEAAVVGDDGVLIHCWPMLDVRPR